MDRFSKRYVVASPSRDAEFGDSIRSFGRSLAHVRSLMLLWYGFHLLIPFSRWHEMPREDKEAFKATVKMQGRMARSENGRFVRVSEDRLRPGEVRLISVSHQPSG